MSSILAFDTLSYSKALQDAGMEPALADLIATKQREAIADILDSRQLATKQDVQLEIEKVRAEIEKLRAESKADNEKLRAEIEKLRAESKADIEKLRAESKADIEKLRAELKADIEKLRTDSEKTHGELRLDIEKVRAEITRSSHQQLKWQIATIVALTALLIRGFHLFGF